MNPASRLALMIAVVFGTVVPPAPGGEDPPAPPIAARYAAIMAEYEGAMARYRQAMEKVETQAEANKAFRELAPDELAFSRRMNELAATDPASPTARDALVWVVDKPGRVDRGAYGDEFARASALLVRHHGDDPRAIEVGLRLNNSVTAHRDALVFGFLAAAKGRESMGLARLAAAQYLEEKAKFARGTRSMKAGHKYKLMGVIGEDGKLHDKEVEQSAEEYADILLLRQVDPDALRAEAERLFEEVASDYGDVVHVSAKVRELEALAKEPNPTWQGKPLSEAERQQLAEIVARRPTLGELAGARLDEMHNLKVGQPAPEIMGVDFEGKPLKLSDYKGKVVALVFWATWCGPCMREIPRERDLVERLKDRPFALLGVNSDRDPAAAHQALASERITWPNWQDGGPETGPIVARYHVRGFPTVLVLDSQGIIRFKDLHGESIDRAVDKLLGEMAPNP